MSPPEGVAPVTSDRVGAACWIASSAEELETHYRIRREVFVAEQGLFEGSDLDAQDAAPGVIHVIGTWNGEPIGVVRLFPLDSTVRRWQGDRLAVLGPYRSRNLGRPLVRFAVATAAERGGELMIAHIQLPNVAFFERLGWRRHGAVESYVRVPHQPMAIDLVRAGR